MPWTDALQHSVAHSFGVTWLAGSGLSGILHAHEVLTLSPPMPFDMPCLQDPRPLGTRWGRPRWPGTGGDRRVKRSELSEARV